MSTHDNAKNHWEIIQGAPQRIVWDPNATEYHPDGSATFHGVYYPTPIRMSRTVINVRPPTPSDHPADETGKSNG